MFFIIIFILGRSGVNDLPLVSNVFNVLMYADDTTLYCNISQDIGEEVINAELLKLWE